MDIELMYQPGWSHVIKVKQKDVLDAGIIKYKGEYYVFDSKRSTPFEPVFLKAVLYEAD